ncbi:hypothetical protein MHLP_01360 [Candidatus Mycoplasma haematolamae str. Purdue]|uniref:Uncharacterized protein n=1 Tax=Mycoplasma haematolamae (strain Purdue) TaxID=1212765 RepID=I7C5Q9_MYCHA|nr:hypothetical protein [Candidatus Mycoplasma haematolamae]AFO51852.1 hypothetical protein MHLP_01360 [Candidatus Mycoplasma haematolamae str. Purdue]
MFLGSVFKGLVGLGALGGIGATGVVYGPNLYEKVSNYISMFKEAEKGEGVKYTVKVLGKSSEQVLNCEKQDNKYTNLKLEKEGGNQSGDLKVKLSCDYSESPVDYATTLVKSGTDSVTKDLTCFREKSTGREQTYQCALKNSKEIILGKNDSDPKSITISWTS